MLERVVRRFRDGRQAPRPPREGGDPVAAARLFSAQRDEAEGADHLGVGAVEEGIEEDYRGVDVAADDHRRP